MRLIERQHCNAKESVPRKKVCPVQMGLVVAFVVSCTNAQSAVFGTWESLLNENTTLEAAPAPVLVSVVGEGSVELPVRQKETAITGPNASPVTTGSSEPGSELLGDSVKPLESQPQNGPDLHSIQAFYTGDEMYWVISGASYSKAKLSITGDKGLLRQTFSDSDSTRLSVSESGIPDGQYSYALVVIDPAVQGAVAAFSASQAGCTAEVDPYGGSQCYTTSASSENNGNIGLANNLNDPGRFNHTVYQDTIIVNNGSISQGPVAVSE